MKDERCACFMHAINGSCTLLVGMKLSYTKSLPHEKKAEEYFQQLTYLHTPQITFISLANRISAIFYSSINFVWLIASICSGVYPSTNKLDFGIPKSNCFLFLHGFNTLLLAAFRKNKLRG